MLSADQPATPPNAAAQLVERLPSLNSCAAPPGLNASGSTTGSATAATAGEALAGGQALGGVAGGEAPGTPPEESGSTCGLTPASLKHLRRQNAKLTEEKDRLLSELEKAQASIAALKERTAALDEQLRESALREEKLQEDLNDANHETEAQRNRADEAERLNAKLEESLAASEAEVARLKKLLEDQLRLTREVCEAAERSSGEARAAAESAEQIERLSEQVKKLTLENGTLQKEREDQALENAELVKRTGMAMAAAEKAMTMHAAHVQRVEQLRVAKLAEAIQHKVELHISVPRVTLSYNNAPPLQVSAAAALGDNRIKDFLDKEVFSHFEPLWVTLDKLDQAPDGTTKKAYSTRMLERLTEAVKGFVEKSQRSEGESGLKATVREAINVPGATVPSGGQGAVAVGGTDMIGTAGRPRAAVGNACAVDSLAEVDRERLLGLLRSGDDRGLDGKLKEILQSRA